ncbi:hypothetical protein NM688_g5810 [Phlebia brevispora]|uniref:Uncharacterized protein n=1 Tax=Phlebia brevispora TaxID=194682 RepID=A0ACC1SPB3_9APHY|nr:hypothetical protein NM688_g5810 [Phlebia brevispora]
MADFGISCQTYNDTSLAWIHQCIDQYLGRAPTVIIPQLKSVKAPSLTAYHGQDSTEQFENWMMSVLLWMRVLQLGGPELNNERVHVLGMVLLGPALEWYQQEVGSLYRSRINWTFVDALCALHNQFVHRANAQTATEQFEAVTFDPKDGVAAYYTRLRKYALRMVHHPDPYTFK